LSNSSSSAKDNDILSTPPGSSSGSGGRVSWTIFLFVITVFVSVFVMSPAWISDQLDEEIQSSHFWMGDKSANKIKDSTFQVYKKWVINSGFQREVKRITRLKRHDKLQYNEVANKGVNLLESMGDSLLITILQSIYRTQVSLFWLIFAAPFILAMFVSGMVERKIKLYTFGWASANMFHVSAHTLFVLIPFMFVMYFSLPFYIPPILPMIIYLIIGYLVYVMSSNLQKVF